MTLSERKATLLTDEQQDVIQATVFCIRCRTGAATYGDLCIDGREALGLDPFTLEPLP